MQTIRIRDPERCRRIVKQAAAEVKDKATRIWLQWDEKGTWELSAAEALEESAERAASLGLSSEQVDEQVAILLAQRALTAMLRHVENKPKR